MLTERQRGGPGRGPVFASVAVHVLVVLGAWIGEAFFDPDPVLFEAIEIVMVSPPPSIQGDFNPQPEPPPEVEVETPDPSPPAPEELPPPPPEEERPAERTPPPPEQRRPEPEPRPAPPQPTPQRTPPPQPVEEEEAPPSTTPDPTPAPVSGMDIEIRMEGLRRDYPEYYNHITTQVARCFRWQGGGNLAAVVRFGIRRDGTIDASETATVESSGDLVFDLTAEGAVECAGTRLRPLPDDLPGDVLPIQFRFRPAGAGP